MRLGSNYGRYRVVGTSVSAALLIAIKTRASGIPPGDSRFAELNFASLRRMVQRAIRSCNPCLPPETRIIIMLTMASGQIMPHSVLAQKRAWARNQEMRSPGCALLSARALVSQALPATQSFQKMQSKAKAETTHST